MKQISLRVWYGEYYLRPSDLDDAAKAGIINKERHTVTQYGASYTFTTKEGVKIATFYKDDTIGGFSSQAYGYKVSEELMVLPIFKISY